MKQNIGPKHLLGENKELRMGKLYFTYFILSGAHFDTVQAHISKNWTNCHDVVDLGQQLAIFKTHAQHAHCKFNDKYRVHLF